MIPPAEPVDEPQRVATLRALNILDTPTEERFDRLTRLAKRLFGVPIALVSMVDADRQWFKSAQGLDTTETHRDVSFCGHAILGDDVLFVPDTTHDSRFFDNPLVTGAPDVRFYAGCPLKVSNGSTVGTLCLIDSTPRQFSEDDMALLRDLARMAEQELIAVQMATMDELTLISNRRGFEALAKHALGHCKRANLPASLLFFDLDDFKRINDRFGHAEGDRALTAFAGMLKCTHRESDVVARLGGDEFAALLTNTAPDGVRALTSRLQHAVDEHNAAEPRGYDLRFSVGAVAYDPARHESVVRLLADADALMYEDKRHRHAAVN